jgi:hypothetical protein
MHKIELIDCQKFANEFTKQQKYPIFANIEPEEFQAMLNWLSECIVTAENLKAVYK